MAATLFVDHNFLYVIFQQTKPVTSVILQVFFSQFFVGSIFCIFITMHQTPQITFLVCVGLHIATE